jgi:hypothetical protein
MIDKVAAVREWIDTNPKWTVWFEVSDSDCEIVHNQVTARFGSWDAAINLGEHDLINEEIGATRLHTNH